MSSIRFWCWTDDVGLSIFVMVCPNKRYGTVVPQKSINKYHGLSSWVAVIVRFVGCKSLLFEQPNIHYHSWVKCLVLMFKTLYKLAGFNANFPDFPCELPLDPNSWTSNHISDAQFRILAGFILRFLTFFRTFLITYEFVELNAQNLQFLPVVV